MKTKHYPALCMAFILLLTGCSFERPVKLDTRLSVRPAVEPMPLRIGVYYSPEFIAATRKVELISCGSSGRKDPSDIFFIFPIGSASGELFDQIARALFASVTPVAGIAQASPLASAIDGVLEPRIDSFTWELSCTNDYLSEVRYTAVIHYIVNLYEPDGRFVASFPVRGSGFEKPRFCWSGCGESFAAGQAIQDAMAYFLLEFRNQPELNRWMSHHQISGERP